MHCGNWFQLKQRHCSNDIATNKHHILAYSRRSSPSRNNNAANNDLRLSCLYCAVHKGVRRWSAEHIYISNVLDTSWDYFWHMLAYVKLFAVMHWSFVSVEQACHTVCLFISDTPMYQKLFGPMGLDECEWWWLLLKFLRQITIVKQAVCSSHYLIILFICPYEHAHLIKAYRLKGCDQPCAKPSIVSVLFVI